MALRSDHRNSQMLIFLSQKNIVINEESPHSHLVSSIISSEDFRWYSSYITPSICISAKCNISRGRVLLKSILLSMAFYGSCILWPSEDTLLKHAEQLGKKKQPGPSWLTCILKNSLVTALKIRGLLCPQKDLFTI